MTKHIREIEKLLTVLGDFNCFFEKQMAGMCGRSFDRGGLLFMSSTPSDWRTTRNLKAQAKRALR